MDTEEKKKILMQSQQSGTSKDKESVQPQKPSSFAGSIQPQQESKSDKILQASGLTRDSVKTKEPPKVESEVKKQKGNYTTPDKVWGSGGYSKNVSQDKQYKTSYEDMVISAWDKNTEAVDISKYSGPDEVPKINNIGRFIATIKKTEETLREKTGDKTVVMGKEAKNSLYQQIFKVDQTTIQEAEDYVARSENSHSRFTDIFKMFSSVAAINKNEVMDNVKDSLGEKVSKDFSDSGLPIIYDNESKKYFLLNPENQEESFEIDPSLFDAIKSSAGEIAGGVGLALLAAITPVPFDDIAGAGAVASKVSKGIKILANPRIQQALLGIAGGAVGSTIGAIADNLKKDVKLEREVKVSEVLDKAVDTATWGTAFDVVGGAVVSTGMKTLTKFGIPAIKHLGRSLKSVFRFSDDVGFAKHTLGGDEIFGGKAAKSGSTTDVTLPTLNSAERYIEKVFETLDLSDKTKKTMLKNSKQIVQVLADPKLGDSFEDFLLNDMPLHTGLGKFSKQISAEVVDSLKKNVPNNHLTKLVKSISEIQEVNSRGVLLNDSLSVLEKITNDSGVNTVNKVTIQNSGDLIGTNLNKLNVDKKDIGLINKISKDIDFSSMEDWQQKTFKDLFGVDRREMSQMKNLGVRDLDMIKYTLNSYLKNNKISSAGDKAKINKIISKINTYFSESAKKSSAHFEYVNIPTIKKFLYDGVGVFSDENLDKHIKALKTQYLKPETLEALKKAGFNDEKLKNVVQKMGKADYSDSTPELSDLTLKQFNDLTKVQGLEDILKIWDNSQYIQLEQKALNKTKTLQNLLNPETLKSHKQILKHFEVIRDDDSVFAYNKLMSVVPEESKEMIESAFLRSEITKQTKKTSIGTEDVPIIDFASAQNQLSRVKFTSTYAKNMYNTIELFAELFPNLSKVPQRGGVRAGDHKSGERGNLAKSVFGKLAVKFAGDLWNLFTRFINPQKTNKFLYKNTLRKVSKLLGNAEDLQKLKTPLTVDLGEKGSNEVIETIASATQQMRKMSSEANSESIKKTKNYFTSLQGDEFRKSVDKKLFPVEDAGLWSQETLNKVYKKNMAFEDIATEENLAYLASLGVSRIIVDGSIHSVERLLEEFGTY